MTETMKQKFSTAKSSLIAAEQFLSESFSIIQAQGTKIKSEAEEVLGIHRNASEAMTKQLGELEETQQITQENLVKWEEEESNLLANHKTAEDQLILLQHMAESRLLQLTTAIMKFESETKKVQERNYALVDQIEIGLQKVIEQNLSC